MRHRDKHRISVTVIRKERVALNLENGWLDASHFQNPFDLFPVIIRQPDGLDQPAVYKCLHRLPCGLESGLVVIIPFGVRIVREPRMRVWVLKKYVIIVIGGRQLSGVDAMALSNNFPVS